MTAMTLHDARVTGGVDTHRDVHVAAALDERGALLGTASFLTTPVGYRRLLAWLRGHGQVVAVGVEGTGSYGTALTRRLLEHDVAVVEVGRPNRQLRRRHGKTDVIAAARAVQSRGSYSSALPFPGKSRRTRAERRSVTSGTVR